MRHSWLSVNRANASVALFARPSTIRAAALDNEDQTAPLKRQPAPRDSPNNLTTLAYYLGRVPPEGLGFRCQVILVLARPLRPPRFRLYAAFRLSLCPASRPNLFGCRSIVCDRGLLLLAFRKRAPGPSGCSAGARGWPSGRPSGRGGRPSDDALPPRVTTLACSRAMLPRCIARGSATRHRWMPLGRSTLRPDTPRRARVRRLAEGART